jgi:hypothetical protein
MHELPSICIWCLLPCICLWFPNWAQLICIYDEIIHFYLIWAQIMATSDIFVNTNAWSEHNCYYLLHWLSTVIFLSCKVSGCSKDALNRMIWTGWPSRNRWYLCTLVHILPVALLNFLTIKLRLLICAMILEINWCIRHVQWCWFLLDTTLILRL